jgi:hypothetical protein
METTLTVSLDYEICAVEFSRKIMFAPVSGEVDRQKGGSEPESR